MYNIILLKFVAPEVIKLNMGLSKKQILAIMYSS